MELENNIAETLARELKQPAILIGNGDQLKYGITLPPGWKYENVDHQELLPKPRRKTAKVTLTDTESYIDYNKRHASLASGTIWCNADFKSGNVSFQSIINDHGEEPDAQNWRDHTATFTPEKSEEYKRWIPKHGHQFNQVEFALFLEDNLKDITAQSDVFPSGSAMLQMALDFEAKQDMRFKSATRLQSGGIRMEYVEDEDKNTVAAMKVFERFQIGIPIFRADTARYAIEARLRYRVKEGKLVFWFELIRPDLVIEQSSRTLIEHIREKAGLPFYFGNAGI